MKPLETNTRMQGQLVCDVCGAQLTTDDGVLAVEMYKVRECEAAERRHQGSASETKRMQLLSLDELLALPDAAEWQLLHCDCVSGYGVYTVDLGEVDTLEKAFEYTLYLMNKTWLQYTNWERAMRRLYPRDAT